MRACVCECWLVPLQQSIIVLGAIMFCVFVWLYVLHGPKTKPNETKQKIIMASEWAELFKISFAFFLTAIVLCVCVCYDVSPNVLFFTYLLLLLLHLRLLSCCFYSFVNVFTANNYQQYASFSSGDFSMRFFHSVSSCVFFTCIIVHIVLSMCEY